MVQSSFEIAPVHDRNEYWDGEFQDDEYESDDEEEEAFDGTPMPMANGDGRTKENRSEMKKMKVKTRSEGAVSKSETINIFYNPKCRGICCMGSICVLLVLLAFKLIIPESALGSFSEEQLPQCEVHASREPFSEWTHHIRRANDTELCRLAIEPADCKCHNPFSAGYDDDDKWRKAFDLNLRSLNETIGKGSGLDLVLYGDSFIERMNGRVFGESQDEIKDSQAVTKELFTKDGGGKIEALPLGIEGEEIHTLMYRLKNGEMPSELNPGAWWLMIGTNDLVKSDCNVDAVVAGIAAVAEEILRRDEINRHFDASHVVINSLFPRPMLYDDPLYLSIQEINSRLDCYTRKTVGMEFFNATELFVSFNEATGTTEVNSNLFLPDGIHLTASGNRIWEEAIVEKSLYLIAHNF